MTLDSAPSVKIVRELFEEYSRQIGVDLCVQNFAAELAGLPSNYDVILVARSNDRQLAGCAALRAYPYGNLGHAAELKRLYVRPEFRGLGVGRLLTEAMLQEAVIRGYDCLVLDTLPTMTAAISMYRAMGFQEFDPGRSPEFPGQLFFRFAPLPLK